MRYRTQKSIAVVAAMTLLAPIGRAQDIGDGQNFSYFGGGVGNRGRGSLVAGSKRGTIGIQLGIFNNLDLSPDSLSTINPPTDTRFFGNYRTQPGYGIDALFFLGEKDQSLYVGVGLYAQEYTQVWRSPSTQALFDFGQKTLLEGAYSVGFMASTGRDSMFGFAYHTHLGWHLNFANRR